MADTSNLSQFLTDVADAIRTKKETSEQIPAENFDSEILSIETGIDTSDADAVAIDLRSGKTAYVNGEKVTGTLDVSDVEMDMPNITVTDTEVKFDRNQIRIYDHYVRNMKLGAAHADVADAIGLTSEKIIQGNTILGIEGTGQTGMMTEAEYSEAITDMNLLLDGTEYPIVDGNRLVLNVDNATVEGDTLVVEVVEQ